MSSDQNFVHLHVHTEYSLLDGLSKIGPLMKTTAEMGMPAVAITDHGTMFGVVDFFRKAKKAGVKPVIGVEAYMARRGMRDRDPQLDSKPYHMLLLAKNQTGYQNLLKLTSAAQLDGYYYKPRIDKEILAEHAEGIIATSGCLAAEIPRMVEQGKDDKDVRDAIGWYQDIFGPENFFLELQEHDIPELRELNKWLVTNSKYNNVPLLATNDTHYIRPQDAEAHDTLLCIQTGNLKTDEKRMRMTDPSYYLRPPEEMWRIFHEVPEALTNSLKIAEMCDVELEHEGYHLPIFPVPNGYDEQTYLRYLCDKGLEWRYGSRANDEVIQTRLDYELGIINRMGFDTYFLIVWDLCEFARHADIWWNVRGSGAGSVAAYALGITSIDPLRNSLIFERFLNPGRVSMPDVDLDYPDDRRAEMIEYTAAKYGEDKVAAIITFGTMGSKAAIRDVGRAFAMDLPEVSRVAGMLPSGAKPTKFKDAFGDDPEKAVPELKKAYRDDPGIRDLIDTARSLEGVIRHASTHAAGVIVADRPLDEYIPLHRPTKGSAEDAPVKMVTQFDMVTSESLGLLKVDFLGLSTLSIMRKACELIEKYHGVNYTMDTIPYYPVPENPELDRMVEETFEMIGRGETIGVFQIESSGMRKMLTEMKPKTFEHIIAAISLYRPGPMEYIPTFNKRMHGEEEVIYHHDLLIPILEETYGVIVYQEQIMQVAADLFGYSLGEADLMRRAVSKKKAKDLLEHKAIFMERGPAHGVDVEAAEKIFDDIEFFARYGFNKSHAADYAVITCQTAFLKTHYPVEYMVALLSVWRDETTKVSHFMAECRRMKIPILPPDVNHSELDFTIEPGEDGRRGIRYGLGAVKNAGSGPLQHIIDIREDSGAFNDLGDFCKRVDLRIVQKRALESLIKVGALDRFGTRPQLLAVLDRMLSFSAEQHRAADVGQMSLFGDMVDAGFDEANDLLSNMPDLPEASEREMLDWERELVGLYVSSHPLDTVMEYIQSPYTNIRFTADIIENIDDLQEKDVAIVGLVEGVRKIITKRGDGMAILMLEDLQGQIEGVMFPRTWAEYQDKVVEGAVIRVGGKADGSRGDPQIIVDSVSQELTVPTEATEGAGALASLHTQSLWLDEIVADAPEPEAPTSSAPVAARPDATVNADFGEDGPPPRSMSDITGQPVDHVESLPPQPETQNPHEPITVPAHTNGNGHNGSGNGVHQPPPPVQQPAPPAPPPPVRQDVRRPVAGAPAWAVDDPDFAGQVEEKRDHEPGMVIVSFRRLDDSDRDRRRLRRLHGLLTSFPGEDRFRIVLKGDLEDVDLDFPNHTTQYSEQLQHGLAKIDGIVVEWVPGD